MRAAAARRPERVAAGARARSPEGGERDGGSAEQRGGTAVPAIGPRLATSRATGQRAREVSEERRRRGGEEREPEPRWVRRRPCAARRPVDDLVQPRPGLEAEQLRGPGEDPGRGGACPRSPPRRPSRRGRRRSPTWRSAHLATCSASSTMRDLLVVADVEDLPVRRLGRSMRPIERAHHVADVVKQRDCLPSPKTVIGSPASAWRTKSGRPCRTGRSGAGRRC